MDKLLAGVPKADVLDSSVKLLSNGNRISLSGLSSKDDIETLKASQFIRIYLKGELKALYSYDDEKKDFKVFKML